MPHATSVYPLATLRVTGTTATGLQPSASLGLVHRPRFKRKPNDVGSDNA
jgi:hypothetical protein